VETAAESAGTIKSIEVAAADAVKPHQILLFFQ
jgi:biotin carboxyl carrier protein